MRSLGRLGSLIALVVVVGTIVVRPADALGGVNKPLLEVTVRGTRQHVARTVGEATAPLIAQLINDTQLINQDIQWIGENATAAAFNESMYAATNAAFPYFIEELRYLAEGSGQTFEKLWQMQVTLEMNALRRVFNASMLPFKPLPNTTRRTFTASQSGGVSGRWPPDCTDVRSDLAEQRPGLWAHNEDSYTLDMNRAFLGRIVIEDDDGNVIENTTSYTMAGSVSGRGFGWNSHGLATTANANFAKTENVNGSGVIRNALGRQLMREPTIDSAMRLLAFHRTVTSNHLNLGRFSDDAAEARDSPWYMSVEIDPLGSVAIKKTEHPQDLSAWHGAFIGSFTHAYHANNFQNLQTPFYNDPTSVLRINRLNQLPVPSTIEQLKNSIGDSVVYRSGLQGLYTLATFMMDPFSGLTEIYLDNPKTSSASYSFPMWSTPGQGSINWPTSGSAGDDAIPSGRMKSSKVAVISIVLGLVFLIIGAGVARLRSSQRKRATPLADLRH